MLEYQIRGILETTREAADNYYKMETKPDELVTGERVLTIMEELTGEATWTMTTKPYRYLGNLIIELEEKEGTVVCKWVINNKSETIELKTLLMYCEIPCVINYTLNVENCDTILDKLKQVCENCKLLQEVIIGKTYNRTNDLEGEYGKVIDLLRILPEEHLPIKLGRVNIENDKIILKFTNMLKDIFYEYWLNIADITHDVTKIAKKLKYRVGIEELKVDTGVEMPTKPIQVITINVVKASEKEE